MKKLLKQEHGFALAFTATSLFVIVVMTAFAIDTGFIVTAKNQLQSAVDAAALAGAAGLTASQAEATTEAIHFAGVNDIAHQSVALTPANISFPMSTRIQVQGNQTINLFFAGIIGLNTATVSASAVAEIAKLKGTGGARPWAIPDMNWPIGTPVIIKAGELGAEGAASGFFYPVDFPPINKGNPVTGAQEYESNIVNGASDIIEIGDELLVEPGNMVGPTQQGVSDIISQDPNAYWDGTHIANSNFPGFSSPRIAKVPLYDPNSPPDAGKNSVIITGLAAFFVTGIQGKNVIGVFIKMTTAGIAGGGNTTLYGVRLIQ